MAGTAPEKMRLHFYDASPQQSVRLALHYGSMYRLDVYRSPRDETSSQTTYVLPENAEMNDDGQTEYSSPTTVDEFWPLIGGETGSNFYDLDTKILYLTLTGNDVIEIIHTPVVRVSFEMPEMTTDEFYGKNIVSNLAALLGLDSSKVRVMNVIRESKRRKRQATMIVLIEIGNHPTDNGGALSFADLDAIMATLSDAYESGILESALGVPIYDAEISSTLPDDYDYNNRVALTRREGALSPILSADYMLMETKPAASYAGELFEIPPTIKFVDEDVSHLYKNFHQEIDYLLLL